VPDWPSVSFHETFWVTVGAAAPVIALAGVVPFIDSLPLGDRAHTAGPAGNTPGARAYRLSSRLYTIAFINLMLQVAALFIALRSLADGHDAVPTVVAQITEPLGLLLLVVTGAMAIQLRSLRHQASETRQEQPRS